MRLFEFTVKITLPVEIDEVTEAQALAEFMLDLPYKDVALVSHKVTTLTKKMIACSNCLKEFEGYDDGSKPDAEFCSEFCQRQYAKKLGVEA